MEQLEPERQLQVYKAERVPFHKLPNLPKPVIKTIDLGITRRRNIWAIEPSITKRKRIGFFVSDQACQTDESEIVQLKNVKDNIGTLFQDIIQLRSDFSHAHRVLKRDYKNLLNKRATELYCLANEKINDLEKLHLEKIETVRKSYRSQLSNAISTIAGEYKVYYEEILQGKTGKQEVRIRELRQRVEVLEFQLEESIGIADKLKEGMAIDKNQPVDDEPVPSSSPASSEREKELKEYIISLEDVLEKAEVEITDKENSISKLNEDKENLNHQLEIEKEQVLHLRQEMETLEEKTKEDKEKAVRFSDSQREALEKDLLTQMHNAEKKATRKAHEEAELQHMQDQAKFQKELNQRDNLENKLRAEAMRQASTPSSSLSENQLIAKMERLKKENSKQYEELHRLTKELDKSNRIWETKLSIMQKNFHALKDESYIRQNFQRQAALLHHATIGYAASKPAPFIHQRRWKPLPKIRLQGRGCKLEHRYSSFEPPPAPTPTPSHSFSHSVSRSEDDASEMGEPIARPRSVHFDRSRSGSKHEHDLEQK